MKEIRIGVIGTGRITDRFYEESSAVEGAAVFAVYNPRLYSAKKYAEAHKIGYAADSIEDFFEAVDAVYIASPHENHFEYIMKSLCAGKHVLCEKPLALTEKEAAEVFEAAKEKHLVLMEAVKTAYTPGFAKVLSLIQEGVIGKVYDVEACFTKITPSNTREVWSEAGGSFTELGSYSLLPIVKTLGTQNRDSKVLRIQAASGVDSYTKMIFDYDGGMATAKTGIGVKSEGELLISGSEGYIQIRSPWWAPRHIEVRHENPGKIEAYDCEFEGTGLRYEIREFIDRINGSKKVSLTGQESIWMAKQIENAFQRFSSEPPVKPKIWAHRGCSFKYPENTLAAFEAAAALPGITGIELDIQLSSDGEIVVIHDEMVDRTTNATGYVKDYTAKELNELGIPSMSQVLELLEPYCMKEGLLINIELKNSRIRYEGMEEKILDLVDSYYLDDYIIYSSFLAESMGLLKTLNPTVKTGILGRDIHECLIKMKKNHADAIHPGNMGMDINSYFVEELQAAGIPVRVWNVEEPFYGQDRPFKDIELCKYTIFGATDIFTNVPEKYL